MNFHIKKLAILLLITGGVTGCASESSKIKATYVSPLKYNSYDCSQMEQEYARVLQQAGITYKQQDDIASNDSAAMAIGMILFWPALFFIDNDDQREEVARMKGELNAIEQSAIIKKCAQLSKDLQEMRAEEQKRREEKRKEDLESDNENL